MIPETRPRLEPRKLVPDEAMSSFWEAVLCNQFGINQYVRVDYAEDSG